MFLQKKADQPAGKTKLIKTVNLPSQANAARFSKDGRFLVLGCMDGQIRLLNDSYEELPPIALHHGWVQTIDCSSKDESFASGDSWGGLAYHKIQQGNIQKVWHDPKAHSGWIKKIALSNDSSTVASCATDQMIRLFSTKDGSKIREWSYASSQPMALCFSPDDKTLVVSDLNGKLDEFVVNNGEKKRSFDASIFYKLDRIQDVGGVRSIVFSPDGNLMACGGCKPSTGGFVQGMTVIKIFDWNSGKELKTVQGSSDNDGFVHDLRFLNNKELVAVSSGQPGNGKLFFLKVEENQPYHTVSNYPNCHAVAVGSEGKKLAVVATNSNSSGNGKVLDKEKKYPANFSPVHFLELLS